MTTGKKRVIAWVCLVALALAWMLPVHGSGEKVVALTFDDGPSGKYTRRLLEGLQQRQVQATFFLCGYRMECYPELTRAIVEGGHEVGLHGYSHDCMAAMDSTTLHAELQKTASIFFRITGTRSTLLRPPGGQMTAAVRGAAREQGLAIVTWSVDPRDWATSSRQAVVERVLRQVKNGDILLLHDMTDSSVDAALEIVDRLSAQGYRFVTVSSLGELAGETMEPGEIYRSFPAAAIAEKGGQSVAFSSRMCYSVSRN